MTKTPFGNLWSRMSRASKNILQKLDVRRLSGGELKLRRYTLWVGCVQVILPVDSMGRTNRGGMGGMILIRFDIYVEGA